MRVNPEHCFACDACILDAMRNKVSMLSCMFDLTERAGSDSHYALVHGTYPIASQDAGTFPDGDEIVIFDADAALPQVPAAGVQLARNNPLHCAEVCH